MTPVRGRFITLEGGEGAGKSTQARLLADWLIARGIDVVTTREPGGSPGAEDIRRLLVQGDPGRWLPWTETLLFFAARHDHVERLIEPALAAGRWVVSDRFADSTAAYQGAAGGVSIDAIQALYRLVLGDFGPDLTIILDMPAEVGLDRAGARDDGADARFERMTLGFHRRVREGFAAIAVADPQRCAVVEAAAGIEDVAGRITAVVSQHLRIMS